jgi:hypothetical protein
VSLAGDQTINERIRARAHRLWEEEGCPEGRAEAHWEQARLIVALEDSQHAMLKPIQAPAAEPIAVIQSLGEFPTLTDQREVQAYPSSRLELTASPRAEVAGIVCGEDGESERLSSSLDAPNTIMRSASELTRYWTVLLFLTAAAAGLALSLSLRSWLRDKQ